MTRAEENRLLLERIEADRWFMLMAMLSNPKLLACAEESIRAWLTAVPPGRVSGSGR